MELVEGLKESSKYALDGYAGFEILDNPFLTAESELVQGWFTGSRLFHKKDACATVQLAYHGTYSDAVIRKICRQGFDPARRHCQGLGPGEYFGTSPQVAAEFAATTNILIATLVISCPVSRLRNLGKILIVNNPSDRKITFCLPVFVIKYFKTSTHIPNTTPMPFTMDPTEEGQVALHLLSSAAKFEEPLPNANFVEA